MSKHLEAWIALGLHSALCRPWFEGPVPADDVAPGPLLAARKEKLENLEAYIEQALNWQAPNRHLLTWASPHYPTLLRQIPDPPALLYVTGDLQALSGPQLAIVGSRKPSPTGRDNAEAFAKALAEMGLGITSGLALGIDAAAHQGALAGKGVTIAIAGTGVDRVYPAQHRKLAHQIVENGGCLVSEYPLGSPPLPHQFPRRNRIISGLSVGTLVVEAALSSGSLITARQALEQGREVFAIPGSIHNPMAKGCHQLIRQGAKLVETAQDILEELAVLLGQQLQQFELAPVSESQSETDDPLLQQMGWDPVDTDTLIERLGWPAEQVAEQLLGLELEGRVQAVPGGFLRRR